jgi:hypothetical protein
MSSCRCKRGFHLFVLKDDTKRPSCFSGIEFKKICVSAYNSVDNLDFKDFPADNTILGLHENNREIGPTGDIPAAQIPGDP